MLDDKRFTYLYLLNWNWNQTGRPVLAVEEWRPSISTENTSPRATDVIAAAACVG